MKALVQDICFETTIHVLRNHFQTDTKPFSHSTIFFHFNFPLFLNFSKFYLVQKSLILQNSSIFQNYPICKIPPFYKKSKMHVKFSSISMSLHIFLLKISSNCNALIISKNGFWNFIRIRIAPKMTKIPPGVFNRFLA